MNRSSSDASDGRSEREEVAELLAQLTALVVRQLGDRDFSITALSTMARLERQGPSRLTGLAADEGVTQPSMTQLIQRLEKQELVRRVPDPQDGRVVMVAVTDAGRVLLAQRRRTRADRLADLLATLPPEDQRTLIDAARAATPALQRLIRNAGGL